MKTYFIAFIIFFCSFSFANAAFEYDEYLEKILNRVDLRSEFFKNKDCDINAELWLEKVDSILDPDYLGTYDANFFISLNSDGTLSGIEIEELRETDQEKFKNFIASLLAFRFPELPVGMQNYVFNLDARTLFIDRKIDQARLVKSDFSRFDSEKKELSFYEFGNNFNLLKPSYVDRPAIGEEMLFSNSDGLLLKAKVIDVEKNSFKILAYKAEKEGNSFHINRTFKIESFKKGSQNTFKTVLDSGFGAATLSGLGSSVATDGIMPGALALMGMTGAVLQESEKNQSFDFVRGDKISLTEFQD